MGMAPAQIRTANHSIPGRQGDQPASDPRRFSKKNAAGHHRIEPGGTSDKIGKLFHPPGSEEFVLVLEGEIDFWIGTDHILLQEGDTLYFKGDQAHGWANPGKKTARVLFTWTPPVW